MDPLPPPKDTYAWIAATPAGMAKAEPVLVVNSTRWDADPGVLYVHALPIASSTRYRYRVRWSDLSGLCSGILRRVVSRTALTH